MTTKAKNTKTTQSSTKNKKVTETKTTKNTEKPKTETKAEAVVKEPKIEEKPQQKVREKLDEHMLVNIASGVQGGLTYISRDGSTYLRFEQYDDRDVIELRELRRMLSSARSFLQRGWIRVLDPEVVEYLNIQKFQEDVVEPDDLTDLINSTPEQIVEIIESANSNARSLIFNFARESYLNGELTNIHTIKAIEEGLGELLDPNN